MNVEVKELVEGVWSVNADWSYRWSEDAQPAGGWAPLYRDALRVAVRKAGIEDPRLDSLDAFFDTVHGVEALIGASSGFVYDVAMIAFVHTDHREVYASFLARVRVAGEERVLSFNTTEPI